MTLSSDLRGNQLLAVLPAAERAAWLPGLEHLKMPRVDVLYAPDQPQPWVGFRG